jgi:putative spermidine/putrescine transport system substrate-binding protein
VGGTRKAAVWAAVLGCVVAAAGCHSTGSAGTTGSSANSPSPSASASGAATGWGAQPSALAGGGMAALIRAARAEGRLNVIRLPGDWANYGAIMKAFTARYGIKITDQDPAGTSAGEISAVKSEHGARAPDVLDLSAPYAIYAEGRNLLAPYEVRTWSDIPDTLKAASSTWYADYGGYVAIGYNPAKVQLAPQSFRSLLSPVYRDEVAITGNPRKPTATGALDAVWAAALANGGSLSDIKPGLRYFRQLRRDGNLVRTAGSPASVASGRTPVLVWWDFLLAGEVRPQVPRLRIVIPPDARFENFYYQAISKTAPHPAAARLWEEFLYSAQGQNLFLRGGARPAELAALVRDGTVDKTALAALPAVPAAVPEQPTQQETSTAQDLVVRRWPHHHHRH